MEALKSKQAAFDDGIKLAEASAKQGLLEREVEEREEEEELRNKLASLDDARMLAEVLSLLAFTSTDVQIPTLRQQAMHGECEALLEREVQERRRMLAASDEARSQLTCFTGTKVQVLTQKALMPGSCWRGRWRSLGGCLRRLMRPASMRKAC